MVIVRIWEGLGNQLFQYAYARALQLRTGARVYLDSDRCYKEELEGHRLQRPYGLVNFNIKISQYKKMDKFFFFLRNKTYIEKIGFYLSKKKYAPIHFYRETTLEYKESLKFIKGNYYLMGWFQNEEYFKEYRELLLKELKTKKKIRITKQLKSILENEETVSIHIRRGDYRLDNNVLPVSYYEAAIAMIETKVECPYYLVFSDDMEWVKVNFPQLSRCYYMTEERLPDYEELMVMSRCKHNIIANSTFSWWGAWLNCNKNKTVIGPQVWFLNGKNRRINIMPDDWIRCEF